MNRIVVKLGTGILTTGIGQVDTDRIDAIGKQVAEAKRRGIEVLIVSSGAIGMGMGMLGLETRPNQIAKQQACASIGQSRLMQCWQDALQPYGIVAGQILLTHEGLKIRNRYLNAKNTIDQLLRLGVVPIINENDSISTFEIKFGNNDLLGAMVASLSEADQLQILSTAPGLIDMDGDGEIIPVVESITPEVEALAKDTSSPTAVGGMISKLQAAKIATEAGCDTRIADGRIDDIIIKLLDREKIGSQFLPSKSPMMSKKRWLAHFQRPSGSITIDEGASRAIICNQRSLLAAGISGCTGNFHAGDVIDIVDPKGLPIARGETTFSSHDISQIAHKTAEELAELYPDRKRLEVVHRDALVLL